MNNEYSLQVLGSSRIWCNYGSYIFVRNVPTLKASTEGPLKELGELLGLDGNGSNGSDDTVQKESTLDIPNITQKEEAPISIPSGSLANG